MIRCTASAVAMYVLITDSKSDMSGHISFIIRWDICICLWVQRHYVVLFKSVLTCATNKSLLKSNSENVFCEHNVGLPKRTMRSELFTTSLKYVYRFLIFANQSPPHYKIYLSHLTICRCRIRWRTQLQFGISAFPASLFNKWKKKLKIHTIWL